MDTQQNQPADPMNTTTHIPEELKRQDNVSTGEELIPSEVAARKEREGNFKPESAMFTQTETPTTDGYTVSGQGLINNHAIMPEIYQSEKSLAEKRRDYTMLGIVGLAVFTLMIGAAIAVNIVA